MEGPLLLASNHPNSFLDAIILDILFKNPIWSLARGDVFKKPVYIKLLTLLKMLPVYRTSEGVENLNSNYETFDACKSLFRENGIVLMFSEGKCINEWHLRSLKKGTARLAISSWEDGINLKVLPVGINYSSFTKFGKNVFINFGSVITKDEINSLDEDGKKHNAFNDILQKELEKLVFEIPAGDKQLQKTLLVIKIGWLKKMVLFLPALLGFFLNAPLYVPVYFFTNYRAKDTDHHDSVIIALLILLYPFYLFIITFLLLYLTSNWLSLLVLIVFPLTARAYVQLKQQTD